MCLLGLGSAAGCFAEFPDGRSVTTPDFRIRAQDDDVTRPLTDGGRTDSLFEPPRDAAGPTTDADLGAPPPRDAFQVPDLAFVDAAPDDGVCVPAPEACDGRDDDCDGAIDEGADCGVWITQQCTLSLGHSRTPSADRSQDQWAGCPPSDRVNAGPERCVATEHTGRFRSIRLATPVEAEQRLGVRFACDDPANSALAAWVESRCRLYLGHFDDNRGGDGVASWGPCPLSPDGDGRTCTSTGGDGRWHSLTLDSAPNGNDDFGVAFICVDDTQAARAAAMAAQVDIFLGYARAAESDFNRSAAWGDCPAAPADDDGDARCTSTRGDLLFHRLDLPYRLDGGGGLDVLGIALRVRTGPDR